MHDDCQAVKESHWINISSRSLGTAAYPRSPLTESEARCLSRTCIPPRGGLAGLSAFPQPSRVPESKYIVRFSQSSGSNHTPLLRDRHLKCFPELADLPECGGAVRHRETDQERLCLLNPKNMSSCGTSTPWLAVASAGRPILMTDTLPRYFEMKPYGQFARRPHDPTCDHRHPHHRRFLALEPVNHEESRDIYQLFVERNARFSTVVTRPAIATYPS